MEEISVEIGDTQTGPYAPISAGSMTLASVGPAVRVAAYDAKQQLLQIASQMLEIPSESLTLQAGIFSSPVLKESVPVKNILSKLGNFMIIGKGARSPNPEKFNVNTFSVQFAEVEIDIDTGEVKVKKIVAVHDSGRVINPQIFSSQIEGGVLQGIGFGLMEQRVVDRRNGAVLNGDLENYKMLTSVDVPEIVAESVGLPDIQANNLGSRGVGEPPIIPTAPAIVNAIADALGIRMKELPITRDKLLKVLSGK
jgi:xanthine dehydrogenase YagR molybdenum-binding subunit